MLTVFNIKQGDRRPYLYAVLGPVDMEIVDGEEEPVVTGQNLTGATVTFNMKNDAGAVVITAGACVVDDAATGQVHYPWQATDTAVPGKYKGEFQAQYGSESETFPNDATGFDITITAQIA
jgi:hypothetical protein